MAGSLNKFRDLAQKLAQVGFQIAGDLNEAVVYTQVLSSAYNTATGMPSNTNQVYSFNGAIARFGSTEVDSKVVISTDAKLICSFLDLPTTPTPEDSLTAIGKNWKVIRFFGTPGSALWSIHIRETGHVLRHG